MPTELLVQVTQGDIEQARSDLWLAQEMSRFCGVVDITCLCMVARAFARAVGVPVEVGFSSVYTLDRGRCWALPDRVARLIRRFDEGRPVTPFKFLAEEKQHGELP